MGTTNSRSTGFAAQFRQLCELQGLKQAEVAERTGIPAAYISLIANGKVLPLGDWAERIKQTLAWPAPTRRTADSSERGLHVPGALFEALLQARQNLSRETGDNWTWREFITALLLYWLAFPPAELPSRAKLRDWYS